MLGLLRLARKHQGLSLPQLLSERYDKGLVVATVRGLDAFEAISTLRSVLGNASVSFELEDTP